MSQQLATRTVLEEDEFNASTHVKQLYNYIIYQQLQEIQHSLLVSMGTHIHVHIPTHIQIVKNKIIL